MKTKLLTIVLCALLLLVAGCKKEENNEIKSLTANETRPTWVAPDEYDYTSSMTAVIRVNLTEQYPAEAADFAVNDDDLLGAFIGEECVGTAVLQDGLFFLYVAGPKEPTEGEQMVSLKYWSKQYTNIFEAANAFVFVNDGNQGTVAAPFVPALVVKEK